MQDKAAQLPRVVVAGASGYVGRALVERLAEHYEVVGLSRRAPKSNAASSVVWKSADLFSLRQTEQALSGADFAVYLVHSMMPTERLTQARFEDLDLILADNFARAAAKAGVQQIIYLGGLLPPGVRSVHLESRREVEDALAAHGVPVTTVRAGLVVGPGGSSTRILTALVRRLPLMLTPSWTGTACQPIALQDLLPALEYALARPTCYGQTFDVGGAEVLTYREMMERTSAAMGTRRPMFSVPLLTPRLSVAWVCLVTGAPRQLVGPLVESLKHPMVARDNRLMHMVGGPNVGFDEALKQSLAEPESNRRAQPHKRRRTARSVQRLPVPNDRSATWVAQEYARWLPKFMWPFLRVERKDQDLHFCLRMVRTPLLRMRYLETRSTEDRAVFQVIGGLLSRPTPEGAPPARLEFRLVNEGQQVVAAVHEFRPRLPWMVYSLTQAQIHLGVMLAFRHHLGHTA